MINFEKIDNFYFVFSDKEIGKFGPFEGLWVKGNFEGKNFLYDTKNLKSWKNVVGVLNSKTYLFEEKNGNLEFID